MHATVGQTQRICGAWRKVERREGVDPDAPEHGDDDPRPTVVVVRDDDGVEITARFDHVRGELVLAAIDTAARQVRTEREDAVAADPADATPEGRPASDEERAAERLSQAEWRAEGLAALADRFGTDPPDGLRPSGFDTTVMVHVGIDALLGPDMERIEAIDLDEPTSGHLPAPPTAPPPSTRRPRRDSMAEIEPSGVRIRRDLARWLACDAGLLTLIEDGDGNPLHLGRRTSSIPASLRRAVMARHRTCAWPGCTASAVQLHHIHHRAAGGHDDVEALAPECPTHHRTIHLRGIWITVDGDGTFHHWRPDGTEIVAIPGVGRSPAVDALDAPDRLARRRLDLGADPAETAQMPRWQGDPLHLADCIDAVVARRDAALRRTIPTKAPPGSRYGPAPDPGDG